MDQRDAMTLAGSSPYYMQVESVTGLHSSPTMSPMSHFQSNTGGNLNVPSLPLDTSSAMSAHGVSVGPQAMQQGEPVRRKRGRPRKYGHNGAVSLGLSPSVPSPTLMARETLKKRGRPPGLGRKQQLLHLGGSAFSGAGKLTPHIINVAVGEDIKRKVLSLLQGRRGIVIFSGIGSVSAANIKISNSSGSVTYEGNFDMVNLSGSYINDVDGPHGPTGGLNVTFSGPDGTLIGGPVEGLLIAGSPVQVIAGTMAPFTSKAKTKAPEDLEPSGDPQHSTLGNSVNPANVSQSLNQMRAWTSSR
ncbi:AT-hook motif nuclear-localized protein 9-like [Salvia hispanica]|uniref:AT-hook motif nuclear-localized protein 9-like n=1 Tax=Salvia hispanica TaxID=49212 RepID=UPI00200932B2|nr:AT-hook motif nuclear-localized protein 9-like [Salvia hispanica]XP_047980115.1 AT-hook motif nuclear-localized protein 9-like [Salvia hispanica]XP_047980116.1 AT-hook motif nuclear-localized protein 9-like [Salvia hispanica]